MPKGKRRPRRYQDQRLEAAFDRSHRAAALKRQDGLCAYCEVPLTMKSVTRDHVVPRCDGGSNQAQNIVASCTRCNQAKGRMPAGDFKRAITQPRHGDPIRFWLIHHDLRINRALRVMTIRIKRAVGLI